MRYYELIKELKNVTMLNNLKKLIIEMVEEEVSTNEYGNNKKKKKKQKGLEEKLNLFLEKNKPTNPSKWSYYKSQI